MNDPSQLYPSQDMSRQIRDRRAQLGLKQSEIARRMNVHPALPSMWENGLRIVPGLRIPQLAEALETTPDALGAEYFPSAVTYNPPPAPPPVQPIAAWASQPPPEPESPPEPRRSRGYVSFGFDGTMMGPWPRATTYCSCGRPVQ